MGFGLTTEKGGNYNRVRYSCKSWKPHSCRLNYKITTLQSFSVVLTHSGFGNIFSPLAQVGRC